MSKKFLFSFILILFFCFISNAQIIVDDGKPLPGVNYSLLSNIDSLIQSYIRKGKEDGFQLLLIKDNKILWNKAYGYSDPVLKTPMNTDNIFRLMSQTKTITAVGIMMLYEQGKLNLEDPVYDYIPEFRNQLVRDSDKVRFNNSIMKGLFPFWRFWLNFSNILPNKTYKKIWSWIYDHYIHSTCVPIQKPITIRDLLLFSSGISLPYKDILVPDLFYYPEYKSKGKINFRLNLLNHIREIAGNPLDFQPQTQFKYLSLDYDILGCIIEIISQQDLYEFLKTRIFFPLGMKDTHFILAPSDHSRLVSVSYQNGMNSILYNPSHFDPYWPMHTNQGPYLFNENNFDPDFPIHEVGYYSAGTGLVSTARDLGIFLQMFLNGGKYNGHQILSPKTIEIMLSKQSNIPNFVSPAYLGFGFVINSQEVNTYNLRYTGDYGLSGYFSQKAVVSPKCHLVSIYFHQKFPADFSDPMFTQLTNIIYSAVPAD